MFPTTITSWALLVARAIDDSGLNSREIFKLAGLDPDKLHDANARYSYEGMNRLWILAAERTGDACLGLKAAKYWHPTTMHALGYSWMASASLKEALERTVRYLHVVSTAAILTLQETDDEICLILTSNTELHPTFEAIDASLAVIVDMCRTSYGDDFNPLSVSTSRPKPSCYKIFNEFFRAPLNYSAKEISLCFSRDQLEKRLPTANAELAQANDRIVANYLAELDKNDIKAQVTAKIIEQLPSGDFTEELIAQKLNKSLRSLQRKLMEEGVSYKLLLDTTRQELAKQYVNNSRYTINEITYLLGFSEPSNFSRAFKRWTGKSPSEYRIVH